MNTLVVLSDEISGDSNIRIEGERALAFIEEQSPETGQRIRVAVRNVFRGYAMVTEVGERHIACVVESRIDTLPRFPLTLVVAIARPQTVKKILSLAAQTGIETVYFVKSFNSVPSYMQSHSLLPGHIERELLKGMEQVWDQAAPTVHVIPNMGDFFSQILPRISGKNVCCLLGEPRSLETAPLSAIVTKSDAQKFVLCIGPEKGWSAKELEGFRGREFSTAHLGDREYRVETALALFIGQLQALIEIGGRRAG